MKYRATKRRRHEATKGNARRQFFPASLRRCVAASLPAFTLIELMISIALVLILMIGINQVFKLTGEATGAGQVQADGVRNSRSAQSVFARDIAAMSGDGPCILLRSSVTPAFKNRADELSDRDYKSTDPAYVPGGSIDSRWEEILSTDRTNPPNNSEADPEDAIPVTEYGNRSHRTDIFSFFAADLFQRQTGNKGQFVANMSSYDAWVWYGHLWLPNNTNAFVPYNPATGDGTYPGTGTFASNPNNIYASQWPLGRVVMVLRKPDSSGNITDKAGVNQDFIQDPQASPPDFQPLQTKTAGDPTLANSMSTNLNSAGTFSVDQSRYDMAGINVTDFRTRLSDYIEHTIYHSGATQLAPPYSDDWWSRLMLEHRFQCDPYLIDPTSGARALNSATMARQSPYFVGHCSQFIVEYAGDFISQDTRPLVGGVPNTTYGQIGSTNPTTGVFTPGTTGVPWTPTGATNSSYVPDGQIDFIVVGAGANPKRQIRWYGLPRDTNGDGKILTSTASGVGTNCNLLTDVIPLRDVIQTAVTYNTFKGAPFEKLTGFLPAPSPDPTLTVAPSPGDYANSMKANEFYTCAWGPDTAKDKRPAMIRIIMTIDDPSGRLADGQTFEYVFKVP